MMNVTFLALCTVFVMLTLIFKIIMLSMVLGIVMLSGAIKTFVLKVVTLGVLYYECHYSGHYAVFTMLTSHIKDH